MKTKHLLLAAILLLNSCSENYSNGERIGFLTKFSQRGLIWKSWEGELNLTQTGMNTSSLFPFSVDNDNPVSAEKIALLDSAANQGWKIKIIYREVAGWNWFSNRGHTNHFCKDVIVLDRTPMANVFGNQPSGKIVDTIFVVIDKQDYLQNLKQ